MHVYSSLDESQFKKLENISNTECISCKEETLTTATDEYVKSILNCAMEETEDESVVSV